MPTHFNKISVIGMGYIGLPTAATFASRGFDVVGVDVNPNVVSRINQGLAHFAEPELDMLLKAAVTTGKLRAAETPEAADAFIIAVPTPLQGTKADMSYVEAATLSIAPVLSPGNLVILESTSPVGATARLAAQLAQARPDLRFPVDGHDTNKIDIYVAHCPERILPGHMVRELVENDRIVGGLTEECGIRAQQLYRSFVRGECILTDAGSAELIKLAENAYRDVNIAFANELSLICDRLDLNVWNIIELANRHPRVSILRPGPGVGGHCIAVDPWFIVDSAPDLAQLTKTARLVNDAKPQFVIDQVKRHAERFKAPVIACLGLAYKPDVDDLRESPALHIAHRLAEEVLGTLLITDPNLSELPPSLKKMSTVRFCGTSEAIRRSDIVVILVAHSSFRKISRDDLLNRVVVDATGLTHSPRV